MKKLEVRQTKIIELLNDKEKVEVTELSTLLNVSQVTIRKDLDALESKGLIKREHGFATLNSTDDMNIRLAFHYDTKQKIARLAASTIKNGDTVMIESGSCCALLALAIVESKKDVTIITNSAFIADYIRKETNRIILLGGEYQVESQVVVGPIVKKCVEAFNVDKFFIGTDGFSKISGFTGNDYMRCETVRDMAKQARNIIVITESTKFNQLGLVSLLPVEGVNEIFTDENIDEDIDQFFKQKNILVHKAKV